LKNQLDPSPQNSPENEEIVQQAALLEKLKFEVGQEMGINPKEKNKNS